MRWALLLAVCIALQLLAGHTQTAFINILAMTAYAVAPLLLSLSSPASRSAWRPPPISRLLPLMMVVVAALYALALWQPAFHASHARVIQTLGLFALLYFGVCLVFTLKKQPPPILLVRTIYECNLHP